MKLTPTVRVGDRYPEKEGPTSPSLDAKQFDELWEVVRQDSDRRHDTTEQPKLDTRPNEGFTQTQLEKVGSRDQDPEFSSTSLRDLYQHVKSNPQTTRSDIEALDNCVPRKIVEDARDRYQNCVRLGKDEEARQALDEGLRKLEEYKDDDHVDTTPWKKSIAELLIDQGRKEEARDLLSKCPAQVRGTQTARPEASLEHQRIGPDDHYQELRNIAQNIDDLDLFRRAEAWDKALASAGTLYEIDPTYFDLNHPVAGFDKIRRVLHLGLLHEIDAEQTKKPNWRGRLLSGALEIYNHGCRAPELYDEFLDPHGANLWLFDRSEGANIFFSAARICTYFDKEGLLDEKGKPVMPPQFRPTLTGRDWRRQALYFLEQGRSRALLDSISRGTAVTDRQRRLLQRMVRKDLARNDMASIADAAVRSIKKRESSVPTPAPTPPRDDSDPAAKHQRLPCVAEQEGTMSGCSRRPQKPPFAKDGTPLLSVETSNIVGTSTSSFTASPASGLAPHATEAELLANMKIQIRWRKALLYALTKNPTIGAVLPSEIEELLPSIPSDTIVVEYALASAAPCGVMTIVVASDGVRAAEWKKINAVEIQQCIADLRASMQSSPTRMRESTRAIALPSPSPPRPAPRPAGPERKRSAVFQEHLNKLLRDAVVSPVEPHLRGKKKLIIIPSGDLAHVPWNIFFDRPITVVPSLNIWSRLQNQANATTYQDPRVSVVSNAPQDKERVKKNLPALRDIPYSRIEALYIARLHAQWPFIADDNDREAFEAAANGTQILHLCAHSTFDPDSPMSSSIQLFRKPLTMADWRALSIKADLVVFSSCLSGISKAYDSGSTIGFAHTLLGTGTRAFMGSLWPVDDAATLLLMVMFYEAMRKPLPAAEALFEAQRRMRSLTEADLLELIDELEDVADDVGVGSFVINPSYWIEQLRKLDVRELAEERYWAAFVLTGYGSRAIYPPAMGE